MSWARQFLKSKQYLDQVLNSTPEQIAASGGTRRCHGLYYGLDLAGTPEGYDYWIQRYYWLAAQDTPTFTPMLGQATPMSEADWEFLKSMNTPEDPFILAEENKEFIS